MKEPQKQVDNREKNGQFRKGASGNPGGRPQNNHTSIINMLEKKIEEKAPGSEQTYKEQIVDKWIQEVLSGHYPAFREMLERLYGKAVESIEIAGSQGKAIEVRVIEVVERH